jgi:hypothetical protein
MIDDINGYNKNYKNANCQQKKDEKAGNDLLSTKR